MMDELLAEVDRLTAENDRLRNERNQARDLVVRSGYFQTVDEPLYDDGGPVCLPCRHGDHSAHQPTLGDICTGCACEVMR
jgi:hypothetical protein